MAPSDFCRIYEQELPESITGAAFLKDYSDHWDSATQVQTTQMFNTPPEMLIHRYVMLTAACLQDGPSLLAGTLRNKIFLMFTICAQGPKPASYERPLKVWDPIDLLGLLKLLVGSHDQLTAMQASLQMQIMNLLY